MTREPNYIPKSAKASDFKITLSKGASEDGERVSFLEQQIQQAKDTYESSLKNVIEECITLETSALQLQENETIYTLFPAVPEAINTLEGITSNVHQKVITLTYLDSSFLAYTSSESRDSFITSYCCFHNLDAIPLPSIHPLTNTHTSATDRDTELLLHTKSLQSNKNKGLQMFRNAIEGIITMPSSSFDQQIEENNKEIELKNFQMKSFWEKQQKIQLWNLMPKGAQVSSSSRNSSRKSVTNATRNKDHWSKITTNYMIRSNIRRNKKTCLRGAHEAPRTKRNRNRQISER